MPAPKRSASLRPDTSLSKKPRLFRSTGKEIRSIAPHGKTRPENHTRDPSDSDDSTSEEDDDEQSPTPDQGHSFEPSGDEIPSWISSLTYLTFWLPVTKNVHAAQRLLTHQRRAAKPHSTLLAEAKRFWSLARQKMISKEERASHVASLMGIVRGRTQDIVFKHDASRIVQTIVKRGNESQRNEVATELRGRFKELVENKYPKVRMLRQSACKLNVL
jgi:pumilio homology domain family member 6